MHERGHSGGLRGATPAKDQQGAGRTEVAHLHTHIFLPEETNRRQWRASKDVKMLLHGQ